MTGDPGEAPLEVVAEDGMVILLLRNGDPIYLSAQDAEETSHRLLRAAFRANGQRILQGDAPKLSAASRELAKTNRSTG